jgi:hypothetical protein
MALLSREPEMTHKPADKDQVQDGDAAGHTTIRPKDVVVLLDAFREGNTSSLLSSVKLGDQAQSAVGHVKVGHMHFAIPVHNDS